MACACTNAGQQKCLACKEAEYHGISTSRHSCQYGNCS